MKYYLSDLFKQLIFRAKLDKTPSVTFDAHLSSFTFPGGGVGEVGEVGGGVPGLWGRKEGWGRSGEEPRRRVQPRLE